MAKKRAIEKESVIRGENDKEKAVKKKRVREKRSVTKNRKTETESVTTDRERYQGGGEKERRQRGYCARGCNPEKF